MHYDNLFSGDMEYVLFIVKTLEENKRVSEILKSLGYFTENVECSIADSIIKNGSGYYAISKGFSRVRYSGSYLGEAHGFCKKYPRWYITTIENAGIKYNPIDI